MKKRVIAILLVAIAFISCDVAKQQASGMYNLVQCQYSFNSISGLSVAGINASNGLSLTSIPKVTSILSGNATSIPLDFTINVDVKNPNSGAALLNGMDYTISIDDIEFTKGSVNQNLNIAGGQTQVLPLTIGLDLASLMKTNSKNAITEIAKNFLGIGSQKSNVSVQLRPTFKIGDSRIASPMPIPLNFSFGGKK